MDEAVWYIVLIWMKANSKPIEMSMTQSELNNLKTKKVSGKDHYFQTSHKFSDRILIDVTEIVAITESPESPAD